jgi:hypothetical protein
MPYGFIPIGGHDGRPYNGATRRCAVLGADTTDIYPGDFVVLSGTASADGVPAVTKAVGSEGSPGVIWGAVVSVEPSVATSLPYVVGAVTTDQFVNVAVATPNMLFMCNPSAAIAVTDVGAVCDFTMVAGAAPYYKSKSTLTSTFAASGSAQLRLIGTVQNGKAVTATNVDCIVIVTEPQAGLTLASVGV